MAGEGLRERLKPPIRIDVIDHKDTTRPQVFPGKIKLETHVVLGVQAVVNKKIDLAKFGKQCRKTPSARPSDVRPAICGEILHGDADLVLQDRVSSREIDTPKVAGSVPFKRLENEPRGQPTSDSRLDHFVRSQVTCQTPYRPYQPRIAVIPRVETFGANPKSPGAQRFNDFRPQGPEFCNFSTRPRHTQAVVQVGLPIAVDFISTLRPAALSEIGISILKREPRLDWIGEYRARGTKRVP